MSGAASAAWWPMCRSCVPQHIEATETSDAASAASGASNSRVCKFGAACKIYKAAKESYQFSQEVLDHLTQFIHHTDSSCRYTTNCRAWQRLIDGGERLDDKCHCAIYKHPPRTRRDLGENDEYVDARWRRWTTLSDTYFDEINLFYNPLWSPSTYASSDEEGKAERAATERATAKYWSSSPNNSQLEDEVRKEGFVRVLTCSDGQPLSNIVLHKLRCREHNKLGCPLSYDGMLSILLYTGSDAYSDLRMYHLQHCAQAAVGSGNHLTHYTRWNVFDFTLSRAIEDLGEAQLRTYGRRRGIPFDHVYHGSYLCAPPPDKNHKPGKAYPSGFLPTVTSFSWDIDQAIQFARREGLIVKYNAADVDATMKYHQSSWCDAAWISKFPLEREALFSHYSLLGDLVEKKVLSTSPSLVMMHYDVICDWDAGCIDEACSLTMADGSFKSVSSVAPGDLVQSNDGMVARVVCTIRSPVSGTISLCQVSEGCCVTFGHPVKLSEAAEWQIPKNVVRPCSKHVGSVYNFVVESPAHAVVVDGVECVTLGHCLEHPVLKHDVWGSARILAYLQDQPSYPTVVLQERHLIDKILGYPDSARPKTTPCDPAEMSLSQHAPKPPEPLIFMGILWPNNIRSVGQLEAFLDLPCRQDDVFVASFPKSGTHWVHKLVGLLLGNEGVMYPAEFVPWHKTHAWMGGLELSGPLEHDEWPSPRVMATHCPWNMLPKDVVANGCRVIYVVREVKDVLTSQFHFCNAHPAIPSEPDLEAFLARFVAGAGLDTAEATANGALLGGIASHACGYVQAAMESHSIHVLSYEALHAQPEPEIKRLAAFLGVSISDTDAASIHSRASFASMKAAVQSREASCGRRGVQWSEVFWRKGATGDWANLLTPAQAACVDEAFEDALAPVQRFLDTQSGRTEWLTA